MNIVISFDKYYNESMVFFCIFAKILFHSRMRKFLLILLPCFLLLLWGCEKTCTCTTVKEGIDSNAGNPNDPNDPDNPDDPGQHDLTNTEKLCIEQGWRLSSVTVSPAYMMPDGVYITDWMMELMYEFEKDDIIKFLTNGSQVIYPGTLQPSDDYSGYIEPKASTWNFNADETKLTMQIPFFYDNYSDPARTFSPEHEETSILELSENKLMLKYTYIEDSYKGVKGTTYTLTLIYVPNAQKSLCGTKSGQYMSKSESKVKTKGKCSDLNAETTTVNSDGTKYHEKTECK